MLFLPTAATFLLLPILSLAQDITTTPSSPSTTGSPSITPDPIASLLSAGFVPITTFTPSTFSPSPSSPSENNNHLGLREIVDGAAPAQPPSVVTQQSPITTIQINGVAMVYTQLFSSVPDPLPGPKKGTIGLGTDQGKSGAAKRNTVEIAKANVIEKREGSSADRVTRMAKVDSFVALGLAVAAMMI